MKKYIAISLIVVLATLSSCHRVFVTERPTPVVVEKPTAPNPTFVWIGPGYIKKGGKEVYRPGYWASPPNRNHRWIEGRWKPKPKRGGWVWIPGHWGR